METQTTASKRKGKTAGRVNPDGQEAVTRPEVVAKKIDELETLELKAREAKKDVSEAIKAVAVALESGYNASQVRRLVAARIGESFKDKLRDAQQQLELFETIGE